MTLFCDYFSVKSNIGLELSLTQMLFSFLLIKKKNIYIYTYTYVCCDFPGGAVDKNPPASARDMGCIPDSGRSHLPEAQASESLLHNKGTSRWRVMMETSPHSQQLEAALAKQ